MYMNSLLPRRTAFPAALLALFALPSSAAELSGDGSAQSPYLIATEADLIAFRSKVNGGEASAHARLT